MSYVRSIFLIFKSTLVSTGESNLPGKQVYSMSSSRLSITPSTGLVKKTLHVVLKTIEVISHELAILTWLWYKFAACSKLEHSEKGPLVPRIPPISVLCLWTSFHNKYVDGGLVRRSL